MAIEGIYMKDNTITTNTAIQGKGPSEMNMNDFLNLLVAQMTNQDMMNPTSDTESIAQMAQFSALQGIQTIQEYQLSSYATSYVGKYVTIANETATGALDKISGYVTGVNFYDGSPKVVVNGKTYDLFKVMEVSKEAAGGGTINEAASYMGKTVTATYEEEKETLKFTGIVTGAEMKDGKPIVIIEDKDGKKREFTLDKIVAVK